MPAGAQSFGDLSFVGPATVGTTYVFEYQLTTPAPADQVHFNVALDGSIETSYRIDSVDFLPETVTPLQITEIDGQAAAVGVAVNMAKGTATLNADNTITFSPDTDFNGSTDFTYTVLSGGVTETATVTVDVTPVNDPPTALPNSASGAEDGGDITGNVITNDTDPENDTLNVTTFSISGITGTFNAGDNATITGVGTLQINSNGSFTFSPVTNYNGSVPQVTYNITDNNGGTDNSTLDITVTPVNDPPVLDLDDDNSSGATDSDYRTTYTEDTPSVPIVDVGDVILTDLREMESLALKSH